MHPGSTPNWTGNVSARTPLYYVSSIQHNYYETPQGSYDGTVYAMPHFELPRTTMQIQSQASIRHGQGSHSPHYYSGRGGQSILPNNVKTPILRFKKMLPPPVPYEKIMEIIRESCPDSDPKPVYDIMYRWYSRIIRYTEAATDDYSRNSDNENAFRDEKKWNIETPCPTPPSKDELTESGVSSWAQRCKEWWKRNFRQRTAYDSNAQRMGNRRHGERSIHPHCPNHIGSFNNANLNNHSQFGGKDVRTYRGNRAV